MESAVRLVMELQRASGETIGHAAVDPDWEPALEWTRLVGLRTRGIWAPEAAAERGVEPLWHRAYGEPYIRAFRVHLGRGPDAGWSADFPITYFKGQARAASARLVEQGLLQAGDSFLYRVTAFPRTDVPSAAAVAIFQAEDTPPPLTLIGTRLQPLLAAATSLDDPSADDFVVLVPQAVLDEAAALARASGEIETGGFLIGHLRRASDAAPAESAQDIFVEVTALVPARHTVGSSTKLTFTADTWTDARAAIALRARSEQLVGWYHQHPQMAWCRAKGCAEEVQRSCPQAVGFLSEDDCLLHRTMFSRAFTLALLMTQTIAGCTPSLFGWRRGELSARGFHVLGAAAPSSPAFA